MPALAAHYFFGQEVFKLLPDRLKTLIESNKMAFDLGLQGPDIFFAYKPLSANKVSNLGSLLHKEENAAFIQKAVLSIRQDSNPTASAYLLGVLCHFALDRACHPFIESQGQSYEEHFALETAFDCKILSLAKENPITFRRYELIPAESAVCSRLTGIYPQLTGKQIRQAVRSMRGYNKLLFSPRGIKLGMIRFAEKRLTGQNAFSALAVTKRSPGSFADETSLLLDMYHEAVPAAVDELCTVYGIDEQAQ